MRPVKRVFLCVFVLLVGLMMAQVVNHVGATGHAQSNPTTWPNIVAFRTVDPNPTFLLSDVEVGTATVELKWFTTGLGVTDRVELDYYRLGSWLPVFEPDTDPLPPNGEIVVPVRPTLDFDPPAFRLKIVNSNGELWDEWLLTLNFEIPKDTYPEIEHFESTTDSIALADLQQGTARVNVAWAIKNRMPFSNLEFEQILQDGSLVRVELPRQKLWVASVAADGIVAPVMPVGDNEIVLRLRVIDVLSGEPYDHAEIRLPITGLPATPPPANPPNTARPTATPANPPNVTLPTITSFTVSPSSVDRGGAVTLTWTSTNTTETRVDIIKMNEGDTGGAPIVLTLEDLPTNGTFTIELPAEVRILARVVLYPVNTNLSTSTAAFQPVYRDVPIHCMATFAVNIGTGGCPYQPAVSVSAAFETFEHGSMVWLSGSRVIYVIYADGSAEYFPEAIYGGLPDNTITSPDHLAPYSGFGKVWGNFEWVRNRLGWATAAESGYTSTYQEVLIPPDPATPYTVLFTLPSGQWIGIIGQNRWRNLP